MNIKKIEIVNYRSIINTEFEFDSKINVFVGVNGSGKTTILELLSIMLSRLIGRIVSSHGTGRFFSENHINNESNETSNKITVNYYNQDINWRVSKTRKGRKKQTISNLDKIKDIVKIVQDNLEKDNNYSLPIAVYYSTNRAVLDIPLRIRKKHDFQQMAAYENALSNSRNDFRLFFEWFREREDYENERLRDNEDFKDTKLNAVKSAIETFTAFSNLRVRRLPLRMEVTKQNKIFDVRQLSDGEKNLMALVGDLARRLSIANPSSKTPLMGSGVVLIDEIDLHLHPGWQRMVVPKLLDTFPNCQFFITTHSPQVLGHVKPDNIFLLDNENNKMSYSKPTESYGKNTDRILEDILGVDARPKNQKDTLHKIYELIQKNEIESAKKKIKELEILIGEDSELVKARVLIKRKEMIGK